MKQKKIFKLLIVILAIVLLNIVINLNKDFFLSLESYGYMGVFIICLFLNASILMPSSSTAVVMSISTIFNPILTAFWGALGTAIGEFSGYYAGFYGMNGNEKKWIDSRIIIFFKKKPRLSIFIFSILPLPLFDVIGIMSGGVRIPKRTFFAFCFSGKFLKMILYAYLGRYYYEII